MSVVVEQCIWPAVACYCSGIGPGLYTSGIIRQATIGGHLVFSIGVNTGRQLDPFCLPFVLDLGVTLTKLFVYWCDMCAWDLKELV